MKKKQFKIVQTLKVRNETKLQYQKNHPLCPFGSTLDVCAGAATSCLWEKASSKKRKKGL